MDLFVIFYFSGSVRFGVFFVLFFLEGFDDPNTGILFLPKSSELREEKYLSTMPAAKPCYTSKNGGCMVQFSRIFLESEHTLDVRVELKLRERVVSKKHSSAPAFTLHLLHAMPLPPARNSSMPQLICSVSSSLFFGLLL